MTAKKPTIDTVAEQLLGLKRLCSWLVVVMGLMLLLLLLSIYQGFALTKQQVQVESKTPAPEVKGAAPTTVTIVQFSDRSREQVQEVLSSTPNVSGAIVTVYKYDKHQNPIIYHWAKDRLKSKLDAIVKNTADLQASDKGLSSDEVKALAALDLGETTEQLQNLEEARQGLIKCVPLNGDRFLSAEVIGEDALGVCYLNIPPFETNTFITVSVLINTLPVNDNPALIEIKRVLLVLQIDIFNRDFLGRETWVR